MLLLRSSLALAAAALVVPFGLAGHSAALAGDQYIADRVLGQYGEDTHKAVQEALKAKGFYSGPVDGSVGPATRKAVLKFRTDKGIARAGRNGLKLDPPLVQALFGLSDFVVEGWEDEACLLSKIGKLSGEDARGACGALQAEADAPEPPPQPVERPPSPRPAAKPIEIVCAADSPECLADPPATQVDRAPAAPAPAEGEMATPPAPEPSPEFA